MKAIFVHGMGRSALSGWPMLHEFRKANIITKSFSYSAAGEDFNEIVRRLIIFIEDEALDDDYFLVGHSLGGVLVRASVNQLSEEITKPISVFLLGSPLSSSKFACIMRNNRLYKIFTKECGQILASNEAMAKIDPITKIPVFGVAGVHKLTEKYGLLSGEANDGFVTLNEISANWLIRQYKLPLIHTFLPASRLVARLIIKTIFNQKGEKIEIS